MDLEETMVEETVDSAEVDDTLPEGIIEETDESEEISESDLYHLYSGSYEGKSLLLTVKDVRNENNKYVMIFDFKCDFVPVAQNCKCYVDLQKHTYEFEDMAAAKKIPLGSGTISRSATGKVVFRPSSGLYELLQL